MNNNEQEKAVLIWASGLLELGWVQNTEAQDGNGEYVHPLDDSAVCFCLGAAISRAAHDFYSKITPPPLSEEYDAGFVMLDDAVSARVYGVIKSSHNMSGEYGSSGLIGEFNDAPGRVLEDVLKVLDHAIMKVR